MEERKLVRNGIGGDRPNSYMNCRTYNGNIEGVFSGLFADRLELASKPQQEPVFLSIGASFDELSSPCLANAFREVFNVLDAGTPLEFLLGSGGAYCGGGRCGGDTFGG